MRAFMRSFCTDFGKRKGVEIDFKSDGLPSRVPVSSDSMRSTGLADTTQSL